MVLTSLELFIPLTNESVGLFCRQVIPSLLISQFWRESSLLEQIITRHEMMKFHINYLCSSSYTFHKLSFFCYIFFIFSIFHQIFLLILQAAHSGRSNTKTSAASDFTRVGTTFSRIQKNPYQQAFQSGDRRFP